MYCMTGYLVYKVCYQTILNVSVMLTFSKYSKMYESDLGINPLSTYRSAPPVIVNVLPDPVCKQNISQFQTYCKLPLINLLY